MMETKSNKNLQETGNRIPFAVPDQYFENFALEMDSRISSQTVSVKRLVKPWIYMAAMFVVLLVMGNVLYSVYKDNRQQQSEMYEVYLMSQLDGSVLYDYYLSETSSENGEK